MKTLPLPSVILAVDTYNQWIKAGIEFIRTIKITHPDLYDSDIIEKFVVLEDGNAQIITTIKGKDFIFEVRKEDWLNKTGFNIFKLFTKKWTTFSAK